jgi:DNA-binding transcriptional regulator YdaS (Cro superfamily)
MKSLHAYLNGLETAKQADYAIRSGTTVGYLRKAISKGQKLSEGLCINLERESKGAVPVEDTRPDVDWGYLRQRAAYNPAPDSSAHTHPATPAHQVV